MENKDKIKNIAIIIGVVIALVLVVKLVWKFWIYVLVAGGSFIAGYIFALYQRYKKKKEK